jgi:hypothetical protein
MTNVAIQTGTGNHTSNTATTGTSIACNKPANTADGDLLIAFVADQSTAPASTLTQASWTKIGTTPSGRVVDVWVLPVPSAAAISGTASWTWASSPSAAARWCIDIFRLTGANLTNPLLSVVAFVASSPFATVAVGAQSGLPAEALSFLFAHSVNTAAQQNAAWVANSGYTRIVDAFTTTNGSGSNDSTMVDWMQGSANAATIDTGRAAQSSLNGLFIAIAAQVMTVSPAAITGGEAFGTAQVVINQEVDASGVASGEAFGTASVTGSAPGAQTLSPGGIASAEGFGTTAVVNRLQILAPTGIASAEAFGATAVTQRSPVDMWLAMTPNYLAHRGGSASWVEMTMDAYDHAVAWNPGLALEVSCWRSSDGVWVASHDQTTGRMFGTNLDIPTNTWATLSALRTTVGNFPLIRVSDLLDKYGPGGTYGGAGRIFAIENKSNANASSFLALLANYGGPANIIVKTGWPQTVTPLAARPLGYKILQNYFAADTSNIASTSAACDIIGADYQGDATFWSTIAAQGKPVWAHILGSSTQRNTAVTMAAGAGLTLAGFVDSDVIDLVPAVASAQTVAPIGLSSSETFGAATVTPGPVTLTPTGIGSAESVGAPAISAGSTTLAPPGIPTSEAVGPPTVTAGVVTLTLTGIASLAALGNATVTPPPSTVGPGGIASAVAFGVVAVTVGGTQPSTGIYRRSADGTWIQQGIYRLNGSGAWVPQTITKV